MKQRKCVTCKKTCGMDWVTCPNCGGKLVSVRDETPDTQTPPKPSVPKEELRPTEEQVIDAVANALDNLSAMIPDAIFELDSSNLSGEMTEEIDFLKESHKLTEDELFNIGENIALLVELCKSSGILKLRNLICQYLTQVRMRIKDEED